MVETEKWTVAILSTSESCAVGIGFVVSKLVLSVFWYEINITKFATIVLPVNACLSKLGPETI